MHITLSNTATMGLLLFLSVVLCSCRSQPSRIILQSGMIIEHSGQVRVDTLSVVLTDSSQHAITISGKNLVVDFGGTVIDGAQDPCRPDLFMGIGLIVKGHNITVKNAIIKGFKIALLAEGVDSLRLENCDFSYNYRQKLGSTRDKEDLNDWLYYHYNESDEWKRYGAAVYLKNCDYTVIEGLKVTQGQNGIMMTQCNHGLFYNNEIVFNSGIGIGLYRSSENRIMHNRLNFNVRGYSHQIYQRGQDSAGLLAYEQCQNNIFAFNSATHSGDGFFLWAGQHTMDTGEGGCNGNIIYANDFSYAPTNGIEVTFSANYLINNIMKECRYGIWGGYSFESVMLNNQISDSEFAIAIEHGNHNKLIGNQINNCDTGIKLWARSEQPTGWGFAEKRNVKSRNYLIAKNNFINTKTPFEITTTDSVTYSANQINTKMQDSIDDIPVLLPNLPQPLENGKEVMNTDLAYAGRKFIIVNEWGPYNFEYPLIWLRATNNDQYIFALFGPEGNWKITGAENFSNGSLQSGTFPTTLTAIRRDPDNSASINFEFIGQTFRDQHGNRIEKGSPYVFKYSE